LNGLARRRVSAPPHAGAFLSAKQKSDNAVRRRTLAADDPKYEDETLVECFVDCDIKKGKYPGKAHPLQNGMYDVEHVHPETLEVDGDWTVQVSFAPEYGEGHGIWLWVDKREQFSPVELPDKRKSKRKDCQAPQQLAGDDAQVIIESVDSFVSAVEGTASLQILFAICFAILAL